MDTLHGQKKEKYFGNISFIQYDEMTPKKKFLTFIRSHPFPVVAGKMSTYSVSKSGTYAT